MRAIFRRRERQLCMKSEDIGGRVTINSARMNIGVPTDFM
jgi:hypothetical protein